MSEIRKVTVLGIGILGSQIAFQTAFSGFEVTAYDIDDAALAAARDRFAELVPRYRREVPGAAENDKAERTAAQITLTSELAEAVRDADLVIEAVPEILTLKQDVYKRIGDLAPERAIFTTNSSTLLPSDIEDFTGRPDKFLALHFANQIWKHNIAEIMGTPDTDPAVYEKVVDFATAIGMIPIELHDEISGYVLNTLLRPFISAGLTLVADGYATPETVDRAWCIGTGATEGPLQIVDISGLNTSYNVFSQGTDDERQLAAWLKENYIDKGKLGRSTGEGFYTYPDR
ncbi:3-hydroxyacyl-CoA dehydrogenase [Nocardia sp. NPDC051052]|uniref:3-hydroxyacyl-CoA dehydrogenase n=1 Tax=Nocardia sp. NPDC051052 TaxID=3364322 RepID=UPI003787A1EF